MALNTNSLKVKQLSLEEGPMKYWTKNKISVKIETKRQCSVSVQLLQRIVKFISIFFIICIGIFFLIDIPYDLCALSMCSTNALVNSPLPIDHIKDDRPSVNYNSIPFKNKKWSVKRDDQSASTQGSQTYTDPIINARDKSIESNMLSISNVNKRNNTAINRLTMLYQDILERSETSILDEEVPKELNTSTIFPEFSAVEPIPQHFSDTGSNQEFYDLTRFWQALSNPDLWGSDNESWNEIMDSTDKFTSPSGFSKRSFAEMNSVTTLLSVLRHRINKSEEKVMKSETDKRNHRSSFGKLDLEIKDWERNWNATCRRLDALAARVINGNKSDPIITKLRKQFVEVVKRLAWFPSFILSNGTSSKNSSVDMFAKAWRIYIQKIERKFGILANVDFQQETDVPIQKMANELRGIAESLNRDYLYWIKIAIKLVLVKQPSINAKSIELEWEKCSRSFNITFERVNDLAVKVINGKSTDPSVVNLRQKFVSTMILLISRVTSIRSYISEQDWNTFMMEIKKEIATVTEFEYRKRFEARESKTRHIVNQLYDIVEDFLRHYMSCDSILTIYTYVMKFRENGPQAFEKNVDYISIKKYNCQAFVRFHLKIHNPSAMRIMCGNSKLDTVTKKMEMTVLNDSEQEFIESHKNNEWHSVSDARPPVNKRKRATIWKFENSMEDPNLITSKQFQSSLEVFFDKMEVLSSHIDRLHERYLTMNELNDDYVSREFSVESELNDDSIV